MSLCAISYICCKNRQQRTEDAITLGKNGFLKLLYLNAHSGIGDEDVRLQRNMNAIDFIPDEAAVVRSLSLKSLSALKF